MKISRFANVFLVGFILPSMIFAQVVTPDAIDPSDDANFFNDLATCEQVALKFSSTCSAGDITSLKAGGSTYSSVRTSCAGPYLCPDSSTNSICQWNTALCVYCEDIASETYITVRTNALPQDCYQIQNGNPQAQSIAFRVKFSPLPLRDAENIRQNNTDFQSQTEIDFQLCTSDNSPDGSIPSESGYTNLGTADSKLVGVATNGIPFYTGTSEQLYDAIFPKAYGNKQNPQPIALDACLGSSQYSKAYHYYMFSPCIVPSDEPVTATMCDDIPDCKKSKRNYALSTWTSNWELGVDVVGVAKDGHMIVGPYKSNGKLWQPCDVDVCNGVQFTTQYVYAMTMFHPYTIGCWGPAKGGILLRPSCTTNPRKCSYANFLNLGSLQLLSLVFSLILFIQ